MKQFFPFLFIYSHYSLCQHVLKTLPHGHICSATLPGTHGIHRWCRAAAIKRRLANWKTWRNSIGPGSAAQAVPSCYDTIINVIRCRWGRIAGPKARFYRTNAPKLYTFLVLVYCVFKPIRSVQHRRNIFGSVLKAAFKIKVALIDNYLGGIWNTSETLEMGQSWLHQVWGPRSSIMLHWGCLSCCFTLVVASLRAVHDCNNDPGVVCWRKT